MFNKKFVPYITEKSSQQQESDLKLTFLVEGSVNKIMIKQFMEKKDKAKDIKVHIVKNSRKKVRRGRIVGYKAAKKKAILTFKDKKVFEEVVKLF